ncbi:hypothetical protein LWE61_12015 [Sphingobium sufflavum]|uniref:hypothetical protein n=1 Tax=Sphingobium sufflavum TaxID=1129547 RepID=UPI001F4519FC|nr:hypothetical protein [Sphingobium sufflavum]MCE7797281.1 hypothetical protein [Sphingobium sufflavum]
MKIRNNNSFGGPARRRRNPLLLPVIILIVLFVALIGWLWSRGGEQAQVRVEKAIPAERLGR